MAKSIIKELIIVLLLCLAIILILGILLYEYVPMSKTIPNEVSYTTPENVKEELLASDNLEEEQIVMTYEVTSSDLSGYTSTQNYKPGKANPFSSYDTSSSTTGSSENSSSSTGGTSSSGDNSGTSSSSGNNNSSSNGNTSSSGGHFFQDTGTK